MNPLLYYIIENDLKQLNIQKFQIEEIIEPNPKEIKISQRELVYVHYVNIKSNPFALAFISDDNFHLYDEQNMRAISETQFESHYIQKYLSNVKIESTCNFFVQYFKIRF